MEVADLWASLGLRPKTSEWAHGDQLIHSMKRGLELFIGVEAIKFVGELFTKTTEAAVGFSHMAEKLGVTTEAVQQLSYAADVSGASAEEMQVALQKLAKGLEEVKSKGTGPVGDALAKLGLHMSDAAFKGNDLDAQLMAIANGFANAGPNVNKTALAMEIFGRSGTSLLPLLNRGADGIAELREEFVALGAQIDEGATEQFKGLEEDQKKLKYTLIGLRNEAVMALVPALKDMAEGAMAWIKANREAVQSALTAVVTGLSYAFKGLGIVVEVVVAVIDFFNDHIDIANAVIIALGVVIAAFAIQAAISWLIAFAPIILIIAAIAALVLVIMDIWESITTGKGVTATVFRWIGHQLHELWEGIKSVGRGIRDFFVSVGKGIKDALTDAFEWAVEKAKAALSAIRSLPGIEQVLDVVHGAGTAAGHVGRAIVGEEAAGMTPYEQSVAAGQFSGSEAEWNMKQMGRGAASVGSAGMSATSPSVIINQQNAVTIDGTIDPAEVKAQVDKSIKENNDQMMIDAHNAVGGKQVNQ